MRADSHHKAYFFLAVKVSDSYTSHRVPLGLSNVTATALLSLKGMPSPVRSRLCPAARYFLKEVDSDTGGSPGFRFDDGVGVGAGIGI